MKTIRKHLAIVMALLIGFAAFAPLSLQPAEAAAKYDLPSRVTNYEYKKGKWVKLSYSDLKYNKKGYLTTVTHSDGTKRSLKYSYYPNGNLKKITCPNGEAMRFNSKGLLTKQYTDKGNVCVKCSYNGSAVSKYWYRYGDNAYYKYKNYPDGSIKQIETRWVRSSEDPISITTFDENGLLVKEIDVMSPYSYNTAFKYTYDKKGRVKSVTEYQNYSNKKPKKTVKHVFSYKNARSVRKRDRYTSLINTHVGYLNNGQTIAAGGGYMDAIRSILPTR